MPEKQDAIAVATPQLLPVKSEQAKKLTRLAVFTPTNMTEAMGLAKLLASSDFVPKDFKGKPGNCFLAMQMGAELGVPPLQALQNIAIINGRPSIWGDLALAVVQAHPDYEDHKEFFAGTPFNDDYTAVFQIKRRGQAWHETKFSVADSKTAKLWGKRGYNGQDTPWITNPKRMLQMRSRGFGLRDKFADALKGMKLAEEIMDIPPDNRPEVGTLDVKNEMATLSVSSEPNRGHGNEGMVQAPTLSQPPGMDQTSKKQDETMCGDCHMMNGEHKPDCFYATKFDPKAKCSECSAKGGHLPKCSKYSEWKAGLNKQPNTAAQPSQESADGNPKQEGANAPSQPSPEPQTRAANLQYVAVKVTSIEKVTKGDKTYWKVVGIDPSNTEWVMSCWHKTIGEKLRTTVGKACMFGVEAKEKGEKTYFNIETLEETAGQGQIVDEDIPY